MLKKSRQNLIGIGIMAFILLPMVGCSGKTTANSITGTIFRSLIVPNDLALQ